MSAAPAVRPAAPSAAVRFVSAYPSRVAGITVVGGLFRVLLLDRQPLWRDEAFTAVVVQRPPGEVLADVSRDSAPPLHYLLEWAVAQVNTTPWALRLVSAIAGTLLIPLVAALARRIRGDAGGLWGAAFAALLPATLLSSRDARMYALAATLTLASLLLLLRAIERPTWVRWIAYVAALAAAIWIQYFVLFAAVAMVPAALWWLRPSLRVVQVALASTAIALVSLVPWLVVASAQFAHAQADFWVQPLGIKTIGGTIVQFFSGPPIDPGVPWKIPLQVLQGVAVASGAVALLAVMVGRHRLDPIGRGYAAISAAAGIGAILLLVAVSFWHPVLDARYASVVWTPLYALAGAGLSLLKRRSSGWLLTGVLIPSIALSLVVTHPQTALLGPAIDARLGAHDIVDAYPSEYLLELYGGDATLRSHLHVVSSDVPWYWGTAAYPAGAIETSFPEDVIRNHGRILYVSEPEDPMPTLPAGYRASEQVCAVRVCLTVFSNG